MTELLIRVLNMSITSAYVILAVLLLRLALKGLPKKYSYALWSVVGFRLVCPVSFRSVFSLFSLKLFDMTKAQRVQENALTYIPPSTSPAASDITVGVPYANRVLADTAATAPVSESTPNPVLLAITIIWLAGMAALLLYSLISFFRLKRTLTTAVRSDGNVYESERITSPFIIGIIKPRIYLPSHTEAAYRAYVLAHERYHLKHFDNGVKLLAYCLLVLHWFNPLVWLAFYLMTKDMEMRCDEAVLAQNNGIKKMYSTALLSFATDKKFPAPSPVSFSENGLKARIKNVLRYKKPKLIIRIGAIVLCLALLTACAANPKTVVTEEGINNAVDKVTKSLDTDAYTAGTVIGVNPVLSYHRENGSYYDKITVSPLSLTVINPLGDTVFVSQSAEEAPLETSEEYGVINIERDNQIPLMIEEEYGDLFREDKLTCITYTNGETPQETTETYKVYCNGGKPFAFCDDNWVYLLEQRKADKAFVKETADVVKMYYEDGALFNEGNKITLAKAEELINNGSKTELTDFTAYEHCDIASGVYDYYLDIADFNGYLEVYMSGRMEISLYYNDGTLLMNYSSDASQAFGQELQEDLAALKSVPLSAGSIAFVTEDEVTAYGIDAAMKAEDILRLLGEPKSITEESDEIFSKTVYTYDGLRVIFLKTMYGEPLTDRDEVYCIEVTDKNAVLPRGIKIGDSLYATLQKLPREYDYRSGYIYGDPYNKNGTGCAVIGYENEHQLILKISCGYWPMIKLIYNTDLNIESVEIVYHSDGIG